MFGSFGPPPRWAHSWSAWKNPSRSSPWAPTWRKSTMPHWSLRCDHARRRGQPSRNRRRPETIKPSGKTDAARPEW